MKMGPLWVLFCGGGWFAGLIVGVGTALLSGGRGRFSGLLQPGDRAAKSRKYTIMGDSPSSPAVSRISSIQLHIAGHPAPF